MSRLQATALSLAVLLLACGATAYITYSRFRFSPDDTWHAGFWSGHSTCWKATHSLPGDTP